MSVDDLISLLNQDSGNAIKTDGDLVSFCELGIKLYKAVIGQPSAWQCSIWDDSDLAFAMREGAEGHQHIDFAHVSQRDHKVSMMYRKFGFNGLEGAIEATGLRKTFAIARLVACFPDNLDGVVPFASSTSAWLERVSRRINADTKRTLAELEIHCIGPETRRRIDRATWVTDRTPALHEQILPTSTSPCTLYVPEVHVLVYGPPPRPVRRWLFFEHEQWHPTDCLAELIWALALVDQYPESGFKTLLTDPNKPGNYETITRELDSVKNNVKAVADYLERHKVIDAALKLRAIEA